MASGVFDDALIKHLWSSDEFRQIFSDANRVQKWYDFEAALALEQAALGIIPRAAADEIVTKAKIANVDIEKIAAEIRRIKHPLVPALKAVQDLCKPENGEFIHFGPTTQDVLDTGTVLQIKDAHAAYLRDIKAIGRELYRLSETYRDTPMVGRTPTHVEGSSPKRSSHAASPVGPSVLPIALDMTRTPRTFSEPTTSKPKFHARRSGFGSSTFPPATQSTVASTSRAPASTPRSTATSCSSSSDSVRNA